MIDSRSTFKFNLNFADRLGKKAGKAFEYYDREIERRITRATGMVWQIAHQKRPMISKAEMKAQGRHFRVSDPNAELGVPVRTGRLQASVTQKISRTKDGFEGVVGTRGIDYAGYIEFGTSKMPARPFIRPAINLTQDAIKRMFGLKVEPRNF